MTQQVAFREMHPHTGLLLEGRPGDQQQFIPRVHVREVTRAFAEDGAVDGGAEAGGPLRRERWWAAQHVFKLSTVI
jgi:hypothetical protein